MNICQLCTNLKETHWKRIHVNAEEEDLLLFLDLENINYQQLDLFGWLIGSTENFNLEDDQIIVITNNEFFQHDDFQFMKFNDLIKDHIVIYTGNTKILQSDLETDLVPPKSTFDIIGVHAYSNKFTLTEWDKIIKNGLDVSSEIQKKENQNIKFKKPDFDHPCLLRIQKILKTNLDPNLKFQLPKGFLLCGPTGTGKSQIAKSVCYTQDYYSIHVYATEFASKYVGESEEKLRNTFALARKMQPSIIVFDEFEAISQARGDNAVDDRMLTCLLTELDGVQERGNVFIIGCVRDVQNIDAALKRPGRFDLIFNL